MCVRAPPPPSPPPFPPSLALYTRMLPDFPRPAGGTIKSFWEQINQIFETPRFGAIVAKQIKSVKYEFREDGGRPVTCARLQTIINSRAAHPPPWHVLANCGFLWERICRSIGDPDT